jgi:hypothetical protein
MGIKQCTALKPCFVLSRELKLRNYTPEDEELKERQVPKAKPVSGETSEVMRSYLQRIAWGRHCCGEDVEYIQYQSKVWGHLLIFLYFDYLY